MSDTQVAWPKWGAAIPLTEAVAHDTKEKQEAGSQQRTVASDVVLREREPKIESQKAATNTRAALGLSVTRRSDEDRCRIGNAACQQGAGAEKPCLAGWEGLPEIQTLALPAVD